MPAPHADAREVYTPRSEPVAEFHVVLAPTEAFFTRLQLFALSLREWGGQVGVSAPIIATVSRDCEPYDLAASLKWAQDLGIEFRWTTAEVWEAHGIYGAALQRLTYDFCAPYVYILDVDTLVTGTFDELPELLGDSIGGVIANVSPACTGSPFRDGVFYDGADFWDELFARAKLEPDPLLSEHTGWSINDVNPDRRYCPSYYNLGMIAAPRDVMHAVGTEIFSALSAVETAIDSFYRCQLALTIAIARTGVGAVDLPLKYNFPNCPEYYFARRDSGRDVRLVHYMRPGEFDRERDTASLPAVDAMLARPPVMSPINEVLRARIRSIRPQMHDCGTPMEAAHGA